MSDARALVWLHICTGSSEPSLLNNVIIMHKYKILVFPGSVNQLLHSASTRVYVCFFMRSTETGETATVLA